MPSSFRASRTCPRPLRLAILGCGAVAAAHARALRRARLPVAWSFASRDQTKALAYARRYAGGSLRSYKDALQSPEVDAVLVATPPATHLELVLAALDAGKDVLVEKPAFLRVEDFDAVALAAGRAGRRVLVTENYFYKPLRRELSARIEAGAVGDVLFVSVNALKRQPASGWRSDPVIAGGPLLEGGVHWINLMSNLGLEVGDVRGQAVGAATGDVTSFLVSFAYAGGAAGVLEYSWETYSAARGARLSHVYGTTGAITFESNGALAFTRGTRRALWLPPPAQASGTLPMLADFVHALRTGASAEFTFALARRDVELAQRALALTATA